MTPHRRPRLERNVKATWWRALATPVLWVGIAGLLWALGAWLLLVFMSDAIDELLFDTVVHAALVIALLAGIVVSRRSRSGYLVVALAAVVCVVLLAGALANGSLLGTVALLLAAMTAAAAFVRWLAGAPAEGAPVIAAGDTTAKGPRSSLETAATSAFALAGLLVLARVLVVLVAMLATLPGSDEHQTGDVVMGIVFFLPIPILAGTLLLVAARWLWRHRVGARGAAVAWIALVGICSVWIVAVVGFLVGQGNYIYPLDDPLLWAPLAGLAGSLAGLVVLGAIEIQRRVTKRGSPIDARP
jgi:hypothetical protein